jgi:hypothetical protein
MPIICTAHTHTQLATIRGQETLDTKGMIASRFGGCLRRGGDGGDGRNSRCCWTAHQQLDREMADDPVVGRRRRRHGGWRMVMKLIRIVARLLLLEDVELQQRLIEMLRVVEVVVGVADDVHVDVVGAVAAHGRVVAGRVAGVHSGHQVAAGSVVSGASRASASQEELAVFASATTRLTGQFVPVLRLPFGPQTGHVDMDAFESQLLLLLFQRLEQLLLLAVALFALQLLGRNRLTGTRLRVGVVGRPPWTFLCVLLLAPLGSTVLEPHLLSDAKEKKTKPLIII